MFQDYLKKNPRTPQSRKGQFGFLRPIALCAGLLLCMSPLFSQTPDQTRKRPTVGVAFEGGGALGLGHIGVIEWLEAHHIPVDYIAGTSMGGLVGGLYATGKTPAEIRTLIRDINWDEVLRGQVPFQDLAYRRKQDRRAYPNYIELGLKHGLSFPGGLNSGQQVQYILDSAALPYSNIKSFDQLPIPFRCVATEMNTGTAHVFDNGSLALALRSTMSLPGIFEPVTTPDGKVYVDGGLLDNLPVDVVKKMGADIVIAIYLKTAPFNAKEPQSMFTMLGDTVSVMIAANEKRNMEAADILVTVDLVGYTAMDYGSGDKIADLGVKGAEQKARMLQTLSVDDQTWTAYLAQRNSKKQTVVPPIQFVEVRGASPEIAKALQQSLSGYVGKTLDTEKLHEDLDRLIGLGRFSSLSYEVSERNGKDGLMIDAVEKSYSPPTLIPGVFLNGDDYQNVQVNIGGRLTLMDFGGFRSELRTDVVLLSTYGVRTEYYHPFTPVGKWFISPEALAFNTPFDLYKNNKQIAEYRFQQYGGGIDLGYQFNKDSELRLGYQAIYETASLRIGTPDIEVHGGTLSGPRASYQYIGTDSPVVPRKGTELTSTFQYRDQAPGAPSGYPVAEININTFKPVSKNGSIFVGAAGGTTFGHEATGLPPFTLGGPTRLGAWANNEILTNQYFLFHAGYLHQIGKLNPLIGGNIYAIGFYEIGKPYGGLTPTSLPQDGNGGVVVTTLLGPLFLGGAVGTGGEHKLYFALGRLF
jgi:NTE family protein